MTKKVNFSTRSQLIRGSLRYLLEHTILKCVTGQHLLFSKKIFLNNFFYCACKFQARIIDGTLCLSHIATILY